MFDSSRPLRSEDTRAFLNAASATPGPCGSGWQQKEQKEKQQEK